MWLLISVPLEIIATKQVKASPFKLFIALKYRVGSHSAFQDFTEQNSKETAAEGLVVWLVFIIWI